MNASVVSVAPGKILFAGEYAGSFDLPLVSCGISLLTRVESRIIDESRCVLSSSFGGISKVEIEYRDLITLWVEANEDYERFIGSGAIDLLAKYRVGATPLKLAVGAALYEGKIDSSLELCVVTELPVGCGLGSSASMCVAVVGAVTRYSKSIWNKDRVNDLAYRIERVLNGHPSGGDNSAVTYGGWQVFGRDKKMSKLDFGQVGEGWWLVDGGKPEENSLTLIEKVVTIAHSKTSLRDKIYNAYKQHVELVADNLKRKVLDPSCLKTEQGINEMLGVVGDRGRKIISGIEAIGGFGRMSGAGGIRTGAGTILSYCENHEKMDELANKLHFTYQPVKLGGEGWHIEK